MPYFHKIITDLFSSIAVIRTTCQIKMWSPIPEYDAKNAELLQRKLDKDVEKIATAHKKVKQTRDFTDAMHYNDLYAGIDLQVMRIKSEIPRFSRREQDLLDEAVRRGQNILDTYQIMYEDDLSEDESISSVPDCSSHKDAPVASDAKNDNDSPHSLVSTLSSGEECEDDSEEEKETEWKKPDVPSSIENYGGGSETTPETPPALRSCEPPAPTDHENSTGWDPELADPLPPSPPGTAGDGELLRSLQIMQIHDEESFVGACAAIEPSLNPAEDPPGEHPPDEHQVGSHLGREGGGRSGRLKRRAEREASPIRDITPDVMRIVMHSQAMETLRATRPPVNRRFSGKDDDVDIETHLRTFDLITDNLNISDALKYAELPNWLTGTALDIWRRYEDEKDLSIVLKLIKNHLILEFSQNRIPLSLSLDRLLMGDQIDRMDTDEFLSLIIKLENLQRKAADRGKPEAFGKWAIEHILQKKLEFA